MSVNATNPPAPDVSELLKMAGVVGVTAPLPGESTITVWISEPRYADSIPSTFKGLTVKLHSQTGIPRVQPHDITIRERAGNRMS